ncbi:MAG: DUF3124 domain-containing protein [Candidatus Paceibacterota bacterium]|jgi:hypothetical protein
MNRSNHLIISTIILIALAFSACSNKEAPSGNHKSDLTFNPEVFKVADTGINKVKGQVLYVPIYSNIPDKDKKQFDLSAFIAIHNTDLKTPIKITKVLYFNNDGELVKEFLAAERSLSPLGATNFYIPQSDQSGTGANFLIEWIADLPVSEPLIESVMLNIEGNRGISFLSRGKVIREIR